jgi:hypothetical protein
MPMKKVCKNNELKIRARARPSPQADACGGARR